MTKRPIPAREVLRQAGYTPSQIRSMSGEKRKAIVNRHWAVLADWEQHGEPGPTL